MSYLNQTNQPLDRIKKRAAFALDVESEIVLPGPRSAKQHEPLPNEPLPNDDFDKGNTKKELRLLATQSKAEGLKESKEKFPNVPRILWLSGVCRNISLFCQAILGGLLFSLFGRAALKFGDERTLFTVLALSVIWVVDGTKLHNLDGWNRIV